MHHQTEMESLCSSSIRLVGFGAETTELIKFDSLINLPILFCNNKKPVKCENLILFSSFLYTIVIERPAAALVLPSVGFFNFLNSESGQKTH